MAALVLFLGGLSAALSGVFSLDPYSQQAMIVHLSVGIPFFFGVPIAALMIARALSDDAASRRQSGFSLWLGVLFLIWVVAGIAAMRFGLPPGVFQRSLFVPLTLWFVGMGLWLLRLSGRDAPAEQGGVAVVRASGS